jgi:hypothetical protein
VVRLDAEQAQRLEQARRRLALAGAGLAGGARGSASAASSTRSAAAAVGDQGRVDHDEHLGGGEQGVGAEVLRARGGEAGGAPVDLQPPGPGALGQGAGQPLGGGLGEHQLAGDQVDATGGAGGDGCEKAFDGGSARRSRWRDPRPPQAPPRASRDAREAARRRTERAGEGRATAQSSDSMPCSESSWQSMQ